MKVYCGTWETVRGDEGRDKLEQAYQEYQRAIVNPIKLIITPNSDDFMIHRPSGAVEFTGFFGVLKLLWFVARNKKNLTVIDGKTNGVIWESKS
jgi:hypothetical protein